MEPSVLNSKPPLARTAATTGAFLASVAAQWSGDGSIAVADGISYIVAGLNVLREGSYQSSRSIALGNAPAGHRLERYGQKVVSMARAILAAQPASASARVLGQKVAHIGQDVGRRDTRY